MAKTKKFETWLCKQQGVMPETALRYVLEACMPYTKANLDLALHPSLFFNEIEKRSRSNYSRNTLKQAYYEAKKKGYIIMDGDGFALTEEAKQLIKPYKPRKLKGAGVMVVFDIPELDRRKRQWFRLLLVELKFEQVQKSVWFSEYDCAKVLSAGIIEQHLEACVRIYEARPIES